MEKGGEGGEEREEGRREGMEESRKGWRERKGVNEGGKREVERERGR